MINELTKQKTSTEFKDKAEKFMANLPYREKPYSGRNWGHAWHSLCSYHGKLKPAIAHLLIKEFTEEGQTVLDPMSGVGTIPFEACLQGRIGIGNDLSEMAYTVTKAKLEITDKKKVERILTELEDYINKNTVEYRADDIPYSDFGLNGKVPEYFDPKTFSEIIAARRFFIDKEIASPEDAFIFSCFLHVLHGNRPYALSRNSHPLTPYAPSGKFIYKKVITHIKNKIELSYKKGEWDNFMEGQAIFGDLFDLPKKVNNVDAIITSPPFFDSIRFYSSNWLRLWLSGWEPEDYKNAEMRFLEGKQKRGLNIYTEFFNVCSNLLKENGKVILHLGKSNKCNMATELAKLAIQYFQVVYVGDEDVEHLEKHGVSDKGSTTAHQFLFLIKK
ncbi:DNA modification methylase [Paenibacillus favisporus]|uniref:DNA modification methylase n=1 Tax=Paenibacillus favisporus TaxID=221028 RepID=A0ABV2F9B3_9BACL